MDVDDDFDYTPLQKKKRKKQCAKEVNVSRKEDRNVSNKPVKKGSNKSTVATSKTLKKRTSKETANVDSVPQSSLNSTTKQKKSTAKLKTPIKERKRYDGHCPNCQMPFSLLVLQSPSWHAAECLECFFPKSECPEGIDCDCTIQNHYWKYSHRQLAEYREQQSRRHNPDIMSTEGNLPKGKTKLDFDEKIIAAEKESISSSFDTKNNKSGTVSSVVTPCSSQKSSDMFMLDLTSIKSPRDITEYLEEAFKEATYSSQQTEKKCHTKLIADEALMCEFVDVAKETKSPDVESDCSQLLFQEEDLVVLSGKSVSDVDASEDSNSQKSKSFFKNHKKKINVNDFINSDDSNDCIHEKISQIVETEDKDEKSKHSDDVIIIADDIDITCSSVCNESSELKLNSISSSQSSNKSVSKSNRGQHKGSSLSSEKVGTLKKKNSKLKLSQKSDSTKQTSLLSFFSGNKPGVGTNVKQSVVSASGSDVCKTVGEKINNSTIDGSQSCTGGKLVKLKNINDVLMGSMQKSVSEPVLNSTRTSSKSSLVKNESDTLLSNSKTDNEAVSLKNRKYKKEVKDEITSESVEQSNNETAGKPKWNCPFYKKIPDTGFTVDAFCYGEVPGIKAYFLSHFHYDHYRGLSKKFSQPIYCSKITGNLVRSRLGVRPDLVHDLPLNSPCTVYGIEVTLLEANHCPGSVLLLFKTPQGKLILHTGDFRADPSMEEIFYLQNVSIHQLYLDTTYCDDSYAFPPQVQVIEFGVSLVMKTLSQRPNTLVVCGSYTIGKERIFTAIAKAFDIKICVQKDKFRILECLEDDDLSTRLSLDFNASFLHVLPMAKLNVNDLEKHLSGLTKAYDSVLAIEPTGWTFNNKMISLDQIKPKGNKKIQIYGLPYSEHSSYLELKRFVQYIKPSKILPTVNNGNAATRRKMEGIFSAWMEETKQENRKRGNYQTSLCALTR